MRRLLIVMALLAAPAFGDDDTKREGIFGEFLVAPTLTVLGFPTPFWAGLETKLGSWVGLSFDYGLLPKITVDDVTVALDSWRITGRFYPSQGAFYIGLGFGLQRFDGVLRDEILALPVTY